MERLRARLTLLATMLALLVAACAPAAPPLPTAPPVPPAATAAPVQPAARQPTEMAGEPAPTVAPAKPDAKPAFDESAVADFYRGKTLRIIVGASAGGGYDTYSRVLARHMGKYLPGNPNIIVENMPGAAFALAANHVYGAAPSDGTVIGNIAGWLVQDQLFGTKGIEFDMAGFQYIGVPVSETYILIVTKRSGLATFEDLLVAGGRQVPLGATVEQAYLAVRDVLGANINIISGYKGTADVRLAMDSGEVDGFINTWESTKITNRAEIDSGDWIVLAQLTDKPVKDLPGNPPTIPDLAKTEEQKLLLLYGTSYPNQFQKLYVAPPNTPQDRVAALEAAFRQTMGDSDFLADAAESKLDIAPLSGGEARELVLEMLGMAPELKAKLQSIMKPA